MFSLFLCFFFCFFFFSRSRERFSQSSLRFVCFFVFCFVNTLFLLFVFVFFFFVFFLVFSTLATRDFVNCSLLLVVVVVAYLLLLSLFRSLFILFFSSFFFVFCFLFFCFFSSSSLHERSHLIFPPFPFPFHISSFPRYTLRTMLYSSPPSTHLRTIRLRSCHHTITQQSCLFTHGTFSLCIMC